MTIILFLVDTSASMCQKAYVNGVQKTYLDIAKGAVETFLKYRQRTQDCLGDRYMLLTFEEPPANVKAGWKENHATFMNELKNLQSTGLTSMGESLRNAFDLLNLNRMQSGIDTYGQGRCPFYLEPSVIIVITDGGRYSYRNGVHQEIILPLSTQIPGTKFTKEPFRWDQRLFSLVLRMPGNKIDERVEGKVPHDDSPIERMCEVTGGRSYRVRSHYVLNQCIESLVQKVQPGVVLQFEPLVPKDGGGVSEQDIVFQPTKKMIYVQKHITQKTFPIGYWPLPEPYWPDPKAITLPPRDAHPKLKIITPAVDEPQTVRSFPIDKYEIEASPLTLQILSKREMNKCWQVIVTNGMHGFELPFGYLKASPNFTQVHLYVLAYNYPALLPLLHDLIHKYNMNPPSDLMYKFNSYVRSIPPYYCPFLRKALVNINVPYQLLQFLLPENVDNYLSPTIANQLKHIKNTAKQDQENLCLKVYKQLKQPKPPYRQVETAKLNPGVSLRRDLVRNPLLRDTFAKLHAEIEPVENYTIVVPQLSRQASAKSYRNPFDIPRRDLIEEIDRMREAFLRPAPTSLIAKDSGHCLPISEMGNYQEYLKNRDNPLREIEPTNVRQHMFGNPYKKDKHMVMVDEADLSDVAPMKSPSSSSRGEANGSMHNSMLIGGGISKKFDHPTRVRKRKAGPLPRNYEFRRLAINMRPFINLYTSATSKLPSRPAFDDDSSSDTSSICSDETTDDVEMEHIGFDFGEEEAVEHDTTLNGYVHSFINGNDDSSCDTEASDTTTTTTKSTNSTHHQKSNQIKTTTASGTSSSPAATAAATTIGGASAITATAANVISSNSSGATSAATISAATNNNNSSSSSGNVGGSACNNVYGTINGLATYTGYAPQHIRAATPVPLSSSSSSSSSSSAASACATPNIAETSAKTNLCNGYYNHVSLTTHHHTANSIGSGSGGNTTLSSALSASTSAFGSTSATAAAASSGGSASTSSNTSTSSSSTIAASSATSASSSTSSYYSHNDINDASEISRILQTCHNGGLMGGSSGTSSFGLSSVTSNGNAHNGHDGGNSTDKADNDKTTTNISSISATNATTNAFGMLTLSAASSSSAAASSSSSSASASTTSALASTPASSLTGSAASSTAAIAATLSSLSSSFDSLKRESMTAANTNSHNKSNTNANATNTTGSNSGANTIGANAMASATAAATASSSNSSGSGNSSSSNITGTGVGSFNYSPAHSLWGVTGMNSLHTSNMNATSNHINHNNISGTNNGNGNNNGNGTGIGNNLLNNHYAASTATGATTTVGASAVASTSATGFSTDATTTNHQQLPKILTTTTGAGAGAGDITTNNFNNINDIKPILDNFHTSTAAAATAATTTTTSSSSSTTETLTDEQRDEARKHNLDLRTQIFRDIRRPGRDYSQLLEHLNDIKGDYDMKSDFIDMCISESMRFRRRQMVFSIQEWWDRKQQQWGGVQVAKS